MAVVGNDRLDPPPEAVDRSPADHRHRLPEVYEELSGARVLVVEDNPVNQRVAAAMLSRLGFRVDVVGDGREAIDALGRIPYVAVLMDCQMPDMNGYQATAEIRRREGAGPRVPIVALTASALEGDEERCVAAGMDAYLSKPVRMEGLAEVLNRVAARVDRSPTPKRSGGPEPDADGPVDEELLAELDLGSGNGAGARLLELFVTETAKRVTRLRRAAADGDLAEIARTAHSIRGSAGAFGARRLSRAAAQFEEAGEGTNAADVTTLASDVEAEFAVFRDILSARFPRESAGG